MYLALIANPFSEMQIRSFADFRDMLRQENRQTGGLTHEQAQAQIAQAEQLLQRYHPEEVIV